jgi:hypothetical protein
MNDLALLSPYLEGGIKNTNFFNGRLLTAEALQAEQMANRQQHRRLGRAIGCGVIEGLEVSVVQNSDTPAVRVTSGMAINRLGQILYLPETVDVAFDVEDSEIIGGEGLFTTCQPVTDEFYDEAAFYLLAIAPASGFSVETAPMQGFQGIDGGTRAVNCGFRYTREGVQFKLVHIDVDNENVVGAMATTLPGLLDASTEAEVSRLRNLMAHTCLGTPDVDQAVGDLYSHLAGTGDPLTYGVEARLRSLPAPRLLNCDVPLALAFWTVDGVEFVDMWSVRRRLTGAGAHPAAGLFGDRRLAEGEATFLQFQEHLAYLARSGVSQSVLDTIVATQHFRFLPSVGILPVTGIGVARGFDYEQFFSSSTVRPPLTIEGAKVPALILRSFAYPPVDLDSQTMLWLYFIRENVQSAAENPSDPPQPYLIFSTGYVPFQGDAQYDLSHYEYGNYGFGITGKIFLGE